MVSQTLKLDLGLALFGAGASAFLGHWIIGAEFPSLGQGLGSKLGGGLLACLAVLEFLHLWTFLRLGLKNPWLKLFLVLAFLLPERVGFMLANVDWQLGSLGMTMVFLGYRRELNWVSGPGATLAAATLPGGFLVPLWLMAVSENRRSQVTMSVASLIIGGFCVAADFVPFPWRESTFGIRLDAWMDLLRLYYFHGVGMLGVLGFSLYRRRFDYAGLLLMAVLLPVQYPGYGFAELMVWIPLFSYGLILLIWQLLTLLRDFSVIGLLLGLHAAVYLGFQWQAEARKLWFGYAKRNSMRTEARQSSVDMELRALRETMKERSR